MGRLYWLGSKCIVASLVAIAAMGPAAQSVHAQALATKAFYKDPGEPARLASQRDALKNLLGKMGSLGAVFSPQEFGVPYTSFFDFDKTVGEKWYQFGITGGSGYQAMARVNPAKADLQANASAGVNVNVILFSTPFPVLDGYLGASNNLQAITRGSSLKLTTSNPDPNDPTKKDSYQKWLPRVTAYVKIFGIQIWMQQMPEDPNNKNDDLKAREIQEAFSAGTKNIASHYIDPFKDTLAEMQTQIGQGNKATDALAGPKTTGSAAANQSLQKQLLNFKRSCKDILGSAIIIPIVPPLNIEIDFGVFFSHSLKFELGISGFGFNLRASGDLAAGSSQSIASQLKGGLKSNELMSTLSSLAGGGAGSVLDSLSNIEDGQEALDAIAEEAEKSLKGTINSEIKGSVGIMPAASAGAWAKAAAVLDIVVASAEAGIKGTLNLLQAKAGGRAEFSSVSDYADIVANGSLTFFSGNLEVFAGVEFIANIIEPIEWSQVLVDFPGFTKDFSFPIARIAYRGDGTPPPRLFMCINTDLTHRANLTNGKDECDLKVKKVPSTVLDGISSDVDALVRSFGVVPPDPANPCAIILNANTLLATPDEGKDSSGACAAYVTDTSAGGKRAQMLEQASMRYPEKFTSNLYDGSGKPVILLEAYFTTGSVDAVVAAEYITAGVSKYTPEPWKNLYNQDQAARADGTKKFSYDSLPEFEPTLPVPNKTPVREIGWLGDNDLIASTKKFWTGLCRVEENAGDCAYNVKALGVYYPDGKGCVSNESNDWTKLQKWAARYDCAPMNSTGATAKVTACLLRRAFADGYCFPPGKAKHIVDMTAKLADYKNPALFYTLVAQGSHYSSKYGVSPPVFSNCYLHLEPLCSGWVDLMIGRDTDASCRKKYPSWVCDIYATFQAQTDAERHGIIRMKTSDSSGSCTYKGYCDGYIENDDTSWSSSATANVGVGVAKIDWTPSSAGLKFSKGHDMDARCDPDSPYTSTAHENLGGDFRMALYNDDCGLTANVVEAKYQVKPATCELMASTSPMPIDSIDMVTHKASIATSGECRDAFGSNLDQLCRTAKPKVQLGYKQTSFELSTRFRGDQIEKLGTCTIDASGSVLAQESAPADAAAARSDSCEVLVGNNGIKKLFLVKTYQGLNAYVDPANPTKNAAEESCIGLVGNAQNFCSQLDESVSRTLRASLTLAQLKATEVYVRIGSGIKRSLGTCDLAAPTVASKICVDPVTKVAAPCAGCDLFAENATTTWMGSKNTGRIRIARAANKNTRADCGNTFKPLSKICNDLPNFPEIKKEIALNPKAFEKNDDVKLTALFTAPGAAVDPIDVGTCKYNQAPAWWGIRCNVVFTFGTSGAGGVVMDGTGASKADLSTNTESNQAACKAYFLPAGVDTKKPNSNPICLGLSRQYGVVNGQPGLKSTSVQIWSQFGGSPRDFLGTCTYDANGKPLIPCGYEANGTTPIYPPSPKCKILTGPTDMLSKVGPNVPEVTDIALDAADSTKFNLKVRYAGPWSPVVQYSKYTVSFPGITPASAIPQYDLPGLFDPATKTAIAEKNRFGAFTNTIGPFDVSLLGGNLCKIPSLNAVVVSSLVYPATMVNFAPAERKVSLPVKGTAPALCPKPIIAVSNIVPDAASGSFKIEYLNIGGTVSNWRVDFTIKNTTVSTLNPNGNLSTQIKQQTAPAAGTKALTASSVMPSSLGMTCGQPANLEITTSPLHASLANYKYATKVTVPCPPQITVGNMTPLALTGTSASLAAPFKVEYSNTGFAPAVGQPFTMTIKGTGVDVTTQNGKTTSTTFTTPTSLPAAIPSLTALPAIQTTQVSDLFALTGANNNCGGLGVTTVKAKLSITTTMNGVTSAPVARVATVTCPAQITIGSVTPLALVGTSPSFTAPFKVEYSNTGTTSLGGKIFTMTIKGTAVAVTKNGVTTSTTFTTPTTAPAITLKALASIQTTQVADLFATLTGTGNNCGVSGVTSVKATLSITTDIGKGASAPVVRVVTVTCPAQSPDLQITALAFDATIKGQINVTVKNVGNASAAGVSTAKIAFSKTVGAATTAYTYNWTTMPTIAAGTSVSVPIASSVLGIAACSGGPSPKVVATVDPAPGVVAESNETNNSFTVAALTVALAYSGVWKDSGYTCADPSAKAEMLSWYTGGTGPSQDCVKLIGMYGATANESTVALAGCQDVAGALNWKITMQCSCPPPPINSGAPNITYSTSATGCNNTTGCAYFTSGKSGDSFVPTNNGAAITGCTVSPTLPAGLSISTSTCGISGTPTTSYSGWKSFTVTASAAGGLTQTKVISINVVAAPLPAAPNLVYLKTASGCLATSSGCVYFTKGSSAISFAPISNTGGAVTSCTLVGTLPAELSWLSISPACVLSGTPTAPYSGWKTITLTAKAGAQPTTQQVTLSINVVAPPPPTGLDQCATGSPACAVATNTYFKRSGAADACLDLAQSNNSNSGGGMCSAKHPTTGLWYWSCYTGYKCASGFVAYVDSVGTWARCITVSDWTNGTAPTCANAGDLLYPHPTNSAYVKCFAPGKWTQPKCASGALTTK